MSESEANHSRRKILKIAGASSVGALGALAGCTGGDGGEGGDGGGAAETDQQADGQSDGASDGGGGDETITISYLSAKAAESSQMTERYKKSMRLFEEQNEGVKVNLQTSSYGDIKNKLGSSVSAGNPPVMAEAGTLGLQFFFDGEVPAHDSWIEGTEGYPDNWSSTNYEAANFRGTFWSGGAPSGALRGVNLVPKFVSQVGVTDPLEELSTWSGLYDTIEKLDEEFSDRIAWETSGVWNDLEGYWSKARTAFTDGDDPWIRGDPTDPEVLVDKNPGTDGMIKNTLVLADKFSSDQAASLADEEKPSLLMSGRAAMFSHGGAGITAYTSIKPDAKFGWQDGEGDIMYIPEPRVNPEYGSDIGISELEGIEGDHGAHMSALENSHTVFGGSSQKVMDAGWDLNTFIQTNADHQIRVNGETGRGIPLYEPLVQTFLDELSPPQTFNQALKTFGELGPQIQSTGAKWDVRGTDKIRWTDISETISATMAGQNSIEETPSLIREKIMTTLENQNEGFTL